MRNLAASAILLVAAAAPLWSQSAPQQDWKFHFSLRTRLEGWNWFQAQADNSYAYTGSLARFGFLRRSKRLDWQMEFAAPLLLALPANASAPAPQGPLGNGAIQFLNNQNRRNATMVFPKQIFVRFHNGAGSASLQMGRFEFNDGSELQPAQPTLAALKRTRIHQRLIGTFGWSHVGRSFDGLSLGFRQGQNHFQLVAAAPTRGVFQVDGWGNLKVALAYASFSRPTGSGVSQGDLRLFGIHYYDGRVGVLKTDNRTLTARQADPSRVAIWTFGAHYLHAFQHSAGETDLLFWGAAQTGRWGRQDHSAAAAALEAGYQPRIWKAVKPWLRGGYFYSTGDGNPGDEKHTTFFQVLPTPRVYARFPLFNLMNLQETFAQVVLRPHPSWSLRADVRRLRLSSGRDLWYAGGGAYQPWSFGFTGRPANGQNTLGTLADCSLEYKAGPHWAWEGYFGYLAGGESVRRVYPQGKNAFLAYLEATIAF